MRWQDANPTATKCPRCGYDVSGAIPTWTTQCPLGGICSECGLGFAWRDLLNPAFISAPWLFEHSKSYRWLRAIQTLWQLLRPWSFWRRIRMEHPIIPGRLLVLCVFVAVLSHILIACATTGLTCHEFAEAVRQGWPFMSPTIPAEAPWRVLLFPYASFRVQPWLQTPILVNDWMSIALLWAVFVPIGFAAIPQTLRAARVRRAHFFRAEAYALCGVALLLLLWVAVEALAPTLLPPWLAGSYRIEWWRLCAALVIVAWLTLFWASVTARYLRLPHAIGVAAAMMLVSGLLMALVSLSLPGNTPGGPLVRLIV